MTAPGPHSSPDVVTFGEAMAVLRFGKVAAGGDAVTTPVGQSPPDVVTFGGTVAVLRLGELAAGEGL
ncbi:hypothetical protein ACFYXF_31075 [Streptomyces sp. NPDC002680]|uniref:hypothetical protein n=1 Tax=Streptomyces sp. NPDC002680 TaxID=3364659 RepID=UPI00368385F1